MKTIKMGERAKRASGKRLEPREVYEVSDRDAATLINMGAAEVVKDHGPDETPDSKRRANAKATKAKKPAKGKAKPDAKDNPAADDGGKSDADNSGGDGTSEKLL